MHGLLIVFLCLCLTPTIIAVARYHQSRLAIFAVNLLFGWTVLGWLIAFIWSLTGVYEGYRGVPYRSPPYRWR